MMTPTRDQIIQAACAIKTCELAACGLWVFSNSDVFHNL